MYWRMYQTDCNNVHQALLKPLNTYSNVSCFCSLFHAAEITSNCSPTEYKCVLANNCYHVLVLLFVWIRVVMKPNFRGVIPISYNLKVFICCFLIFHIFIFVVQLSLFFKVQKLDNGKCLSGFCF